MMFFFFQAEDGIRDATVTGVQTCALPILLYDRTSLSTSVAANVIGFAASSAVVTAAAVATGAWFTWVMVRLTVAVFESTVPSFRSEERRVGKEGTMRWAKGASKKQVVQHG